MPDARYGCENMVANLERVLVRRPEEAACAHWLEYGWRSAPDFAKLLREHDGFCALLESAGAEVVYGAPVPLALDAIYTFDPAIVSPHCAIVLRSGKDLRLAEAEATARDLAAAGIPVLATLEPPATADGGDTIWLDDRTLLVGRGYRTNAAGVAALRAAGRFPFRLLLTGAQTRHWNSLDRLLKRLQLQDVVSHLGQVPYDTILRLIRGAECIVFPSQFEGFGIPVVEAAALNRKVITSQLEVFEEIGVPSACRIDFADPEAFARALADTSPTQLLRQPWTWSACARATLEVLRATANTTRTMPFHQSFARGSAVPPAERLVA
jgi:hypothetical protein